MYFLQCSGLLLKMFQLCRLVGKGLNREAEKKKKNQSTAAKTCTGWSKMEKLAHL